MAGFVPPPRVNVLGVGISVLNLDTVVEVLKHALREGKRGYVTVTGVHGVIESQTDETLRQIHNQSLLSTPDGMPMVWMGRFAGHRIMGRVYGPDLMERVFEWSQNGDVTHYFYGGNVGVAEELKKRLELRFPGIRIVGTFTPPFRPLTDSEFADLSRDVSRSRPDFFWVGLSTPKQERFMAEHASKLDAGILVGVGAAFDFFAGRVQQAPRWIQRSGFEWLYRLTRDFKRLWPRYSRIVPLFLWKAGLQLAGRRPRPLE